MCSSSPLAVFSIWLEPQTIAAYIAAGAAVAYTVLTVGILRATSQNTTATRKILEAAYRPYVGVKNISIDFKTLGDAAVKISINNVGSVPAQDIIVEREFSTFGGRKVTEKTERRLSLLPGCSFDIPFLIPEDIRSFLNQRDATVRVTLSYRGTTERTYRSDEVFKYGGPHGMEFIPVESHMS